jgi:hypothetical protein
MKSFNESYEATSEKSHLGGGHRAHLKNPRGTTSYLGSVTYKNPDHAKGEAQVYHDAYFDTAGRSGSENRASKAVWAYRAKNKKHIHK